MRAGLTTAIATCQAMFGAAAAVSLAPIIGLAAPTDGAAEPYQRYLAAVDAFNADDDPNCEDEDHGRVMEFCYATFDAPILTPADASAKVRLTAAAFESDELSHGNEVAAMEQVARCLEGN